MSFLRRKGKIIYKNGDIYNGDLNPESLSPEGEGKLNYYDSDKDYYDGAWKHGFINGYGRMLWKNGSQYIGDFLQGARTGRGVFIDSDGKRYQGNWVNGMLHGDCETSERIYYEFGH